METDDSSDFSPTPPRTVARRACGCAGRGVSTPSLTRISSRQPPNAWRRSLLRPPVANPLQPLVASTKSRPRTPMPRLALCITEADDHAAAFLALSQSLPLACRREQVWRMRVLVERRQWQRLARWIYFSMRVHGHSTLRLAGGFPQDIKLLRTALTQITSFRLCPPLLLLPGAESIELQRLSMPLAHLWLQQRQLHLLDRQLLLLDCQLDLSQFQLT